MPFVPTQKQADSLYLLLQQLIRENVEIRIIRFERWGNGNNVRNCELEIFCLENIDRYVIYHDGKIEEKYKRRF